MNMKNVDFFNKKVKDIKFDLDNTQYKYVETVGTGAYGVVCHAKSSCDNNDYAIKKIKNPFTNQVTLIRSLREIRILSHFNHPNIINIVDIFLQTNLNIQDIYVVFNLMESDLHKIIYSNQNLSDDHIRYFMYQILCGVNYIHSASVIHRDLKPANILINSNCLVKITDFGMARLCANSVKQNASFPQSNINLNMTQYVMTRWYRAPELLMGQMNYSTKIDLWSCGCIISELYLKKAIFRGDNMILQLKDIIKKIGIPNSKFRSKMLPIVNSIIDNEGEVIAPPISELVPSAPKKVIDLLSHLLVYDPDERWSAKQALRHIFFVKYRNHAKETTCESTLQLEFEDEPRSIESLRMKLLDEISLISLKSNTFSSNTSSSITLEVKDEKITSPHSFEQNEKGAISAMSHLSERTLSADFDKDPCFPREHHDRPTQVCSSNDSVQIMNSHLKTSTISQFTRNKLINSIKQPKDKLQKRMTAIQRQKQRKERRLKMKRNRNEHTKDKFVKLEKDSEQLSELDTFSLKRWEYLSTSRQTNMEVNVQDGNKQSTLAKDPSKLEQKQSNDDIDGMSAGMLSSLSLFDDLDVLLSSNIKEDAECGKTDNSVNVDDFLSMYDIDCIDLDLNMLECFSTDFFNESRRSSD